jgi:hypothetical protein
MRTPPSAPWIVRLSVSVYREIIHDVGPTSYFRPYGDLTIQLFRECCQDAYRQRGILENAQYIHFGVIMYGTGQIWLANARLEVIEQDGMLSA